MTVIIKPKRSETGSSSPTTSDIAVGELAINTVDQKIFVRDSNDSIVTIANFTEIPENLEEQLATLSSATESLTFPVGDYGNLTESSMDAFGQSTDNIFYDCLTTPSGSLATKDLGALT